MDDETRDHLNLVYKMITELANQGYELQKQVLELQKKVALLELRNPIIGKIQ